MKPRDAKQQSLFEDMPIEPPEDATAMVRVGASESGEFSPLQKKFNAQTRKIEGLRRNIDDRTRVYNELLAYWGGKLAPVEGKVAGLQTRLAFSLEVRANGFKLGPRQRETVGEAIIGLLDHAFSQSPPEKEAQELFSRWNDTSFDEELEQQESEMTEALSEAIRDHFGIDIDGEILRRGPEAIGEVLEEAMRNAQADEGHTQRKKTQKQLAKEERERQAEEFAKKSLRSLYLSLAKILHPDAERDESAKDEKEKLMKEVTAAYEAADIHTLLRIENEWVDRESSNSGPLPEEKLKVYLSALKEQAQDLEDELASLNFSPRYGPIQSFLDDDVVWGKHRIDAAAREEKSRIKLLEALLLEFAGKMDKQDFIGRVRGLVGE
ncbi:MAG: hypothetical protein ACLQMF_16445 [Rectinemataceae bacterium]